MIGTLVIKILHGSPELMYRFLESTGTKNKNFVNVVEFHYILIIKISLCQLSYEVSTLVRFGSEVIVRLG